MCNHKQNTLNIAVGHRFGGYIHMFKAFYIIQWCIGICYSGFILLQTIYLMTEHQKIDHIN